MALSNCDGLFVVVVVVVMVLLEPEKKSLGKSILSSWKRIKLFYVTIAVVVVCC